LSPKRRRKKKSKKPLFFIFLIICVVLVFAAFKTNYISKPNLAVISNYYEKYAHRCTIKQIDTEDLETATFSIQMLKSNDLVKFNQSLMLINQEHLLNNDFVPDIINYKDTGVELNRCMHDSFSSLSKKITNEFSTPLYVSSSYRTKKDQQEVLQTHKDTATDVGASEHQAGLALDVYVKYYSGKSFIKSDAGKYVNSSCWEDGFIIRYPRGKSAVTGIDYEPWHIRYIGIPHSEVIFKNDLTLEEYVEKLEIGSFYKIGNYIVTRQKIGDTILLPNHFLECIISPDNMGNYIATIEI